MPQRLFWAAVKELPRIEAAESLRLSQVALFGNPGLKPETAKSILDVWQARAAGEAPETRTRSTGMGALAAMKRANEEARAKGELWEQRVAAAEADAA